MIEARILDLKVTFALIKWLTVIANVKGWKELISILEKRFHSIFYAKTVTFSSNTC